MTKKRSGYIVESFIAIVIIAVVVSGFVLSGRDAQKRGNEKVAVVRQYLTNMKTAFDNNVSFSCISEKAQLVEENMSKLNGYTMTYDDSGVVQNITFSKGSHFFNEGQCEAIGLLL